MQLLCRSVSDVGSCSVVIGAAAVVIFDFIHPHYYSSSVYNPSTAATVVVTLYARL
jgi:hypothetical protein